MAGTVAGVAQGNVAFSQYFKLDVNFTYNHIITDKHRLVWHAAAGVALPYGNSQSIPYEKRYFAGGSNHVRGWVARTLGPGAYHGDGTRIDYVYSEDGTGKDKMVYNDGRALFVLRDGRMLWQDKKENTGNGVEFTKFP